MVRAVASSYRGGGLSDDDLVQEGSLGLLEAIDEYDAERGSRFEDYARFRVRCAIRDALTDRARLIRLPRQVVDRRRALDRAELRLVTAGRRPTPRALAAATGLSLGAVLEARSVTQAPISLDEPLVRDGASLAALVADPAATDPAADTILLSQREALQHAVEQLPPRQRQVISACWGMNGVEERSATDLARELNLSPRRTQAMVQEGLDSLRRDSELAGAVSERHEPFAHPA
jgi:RNA polymerase primary sigma factor